MRDIKAPAGFQVEFITPHGAEISRLWRDDSDNEFHFEFTEKGLEVRGTVIGDEPGLIESEWPGVWNEQGSMVMFDVTQYGFWAALTTPEWKAIREVGHALTAWYDEQPAEKDPDSDHDRRVEEDHF